MLNCLTLKYCVFYIPNFSWAPTTKMLSLKWPTHNWHQPKAKKDQVGVIF